MNYIRDGYVIDDLTAVHDQQLDIEIDWLTGTFAPVSMQPERIRASIQYYCSSLEGQLVQQNVDLASITLLRFRWPAGARKFMIATDDHGKDYRIYVNESK
ncbi:hypothetical protein [Mycetohabitans sp. B46]|uniref:hypothetical protein n=1 Tax=Mycetohabitans sp. B46 TaxID=2772536 RepID=UPI00307D6132